MALRVGLTYTQMKVGWAYKRLNELKGEISEFRKNAYFLTSNDDIDNSRYRVCIHQQITPDAIGMLVGEFAYCLRSALDHLAWQLALFGTDKPGRMTSFPIDSEKPLPTNKGYREKIAHIPPIPLGIIEELQPYKCGSAFKGHALWQLNKLCNIDKHQVVAIGHIPLDVQVLPTVSGVWRRDLDHAIEISIPLAEKDKLQLNVNVPGIVFGEPIDRTDAASGFEITVEGLGRLYDFVRYDAVPRFARFFP